MTNFEKYISGLTVDGFLNWISCATCNSFDAGWKAYK